MATDLEFLRFLDRGIIYHIFLLKICCKHKKFIAVKFKVLKANVLKATGVTFKQKNASMQEMWEKSRNFSLW